jgi:hypothetical protein
LEQKGLTATSTASWLTSTICHVVNVVFSEQQFVDNFFFSVNHRMSRQNHKTKKTEKAFWINATLAHNSSVESDLNIVHIPPEGNHSRLKSHDRFSLILNIDDDPHIASLETDRAINLLDVNQLTRRHSERKFLTSLRSNVSWKRAWRSPEHTTMNPGTLLSLRWQRFQA